jgi:DNA mismatch endonuclease (patch repair protein)
MADVHDKTTRSYNMSRIKSSNTKPKIIVRKYLHSKGLRFRLYNKNLSGKPDLTFPKYKSLIFINGCFWHGHEDCKYFMIPKTRTEFWLNKIKNNIFRDKENTIKLESEGWNVITIWECELKKDKQKVTLDLILKRIINQNLNTYEAI